MTIVSAAPAGGDVPARAESAREAASKKKARRRKFDASKADLHVSFGFSLNKGGDGPAEYEQWASEIRIVTAEAWEAEKEAARTWPKAKRMAHHAWASKGLDDGRILLCRLVPPNMLQVLHGDDHFPPAARSVRAFRGRLLDWLESQEGVGDRAEVTLNGEGACTILFGVPNDRGSREAVTLELKHSDDLGEF